MNPITEIFGSLLYDSLQKQTSFDDCFEKDSQYSQQNNIRGLLYESYNGDIREFVVPPSEIFRRKTPDILNKNKPSMDVG